MPTKKSRRGTAEGRRLGRADAARFVADTRAIDQFLGSESGPVAKELAKSSIRIERMAKRLCPVDTGRLRASIAWRVDVDGQGLYAQVGTNVSYAEPVEFGVGPDEDRAQPFLRPALEEERRRLAK